jgi:Helix-turn-helix domain
MPNYRIGLHGPSEVTLCAAEQVYPVIIAHLSQVELAQRWGISPRTLERWRWLGQGPKFLKLGGRVVYRIQDVENYEAEQLRSSTTELPSLHSE